MTALRFPPATTRAPSARSPLRFTSLRSPAHHSSFIAHRFPPLPGPIGTSPGPTRDLFFMRLLLHPLPNPSDPHDFRALRAVSAMRAFLICVHPRSSAVPSSFIPPAPHLAFPPFPPKTNPMQVKLLDLTAQYINIRREIRKVIDDICDAQAFVLGPTVERFEKNLAAPFTLPGLHYFRWP